MKLHDNSFQTPYSVGVEDFFEVRFQLIMLWEVIANSLEALWSAISVLFALIARCILRLEVQMKGSLESEKNSAAKFCVFITELGHSFIHLLAG